MAQFLGPCILNTITHPQWWFLSSKLLQAFQQNPDIAACSQNLPDATGFLNDEVTAAGTQSNIRDVEGPGSMCWDSENQETRIEWFLFHGQKWWYLVPITFSRTKHIFTTKWMQLLRVLARPCQGEEGRSWHLPSWSFFLKLSNNHFFFKRVFSYCC